MRTSYLEAPIVLAGIGAVLVPAAAPAEMKLRRSSEFLNLEKQGRLHSKVADLNWLMPAATRLPRWIMGPS